MKYYAVDIESTGLIREVDMLRCFAYWSPKDSGVITDPVKIKEWLQANEDSFLIWHNGKFDQKFIHYHLNYWPQVSFDTRLAASLSPNRCDSLGLGALIEHYLGLPSHKEEAWKLDIDTCSSYCLADCEYTYKIAQILIKELIENNNYNFFMEYLMPASEILSQTEDVGVLIDKELLNSEWSSRIRDINRFDEYLRAQYKDLIQEYEDAKIDKHLIKAPKTKKTREELRQHKDYKFNFASPAQRLWLIKDKLGFPCEIATYPGGKKKITYSANKHVIEDYVGKHPIIEDLLTLSKLEAQEQYSHSYLQALTPSGRIHTNFNLDVARTGRLSSSGPNLQNVGRDGD